MAEEITKLELRIRELEDQLKGFRTARAPQSLTADEVSAYQKVRGVLAADFGDMCGVNECQQLRPCACYRCYFCHFCSRCITECTCGPCLACWTGGPLAAGARRFGGLGEE